MNDKETYLMGHFKIHQTLSYLVITLDNLVEMLHY